MPGYWHALTQQEIVEYFKTDINKGLSNEEVRKRASIFGPNELAGIPRVLPWQLFMNQFKNFMVLVLLAANVVSVFEGEYTEAVTIMVIILVNAVLGFIQEYRAECSMGALKQLAVPEAIVIRDGQERKISAVELVPGDIVLLEEGKRVPADLRLLQAVDLEIEESVLTGKSIPVSKLAEALPGKDLPPGNLLNMAFMSTMVTRGRGRGLVVHTGMATELGFITGMRQKAGQEEMLLQRRLVQLRKVLVAFCLFICAVIVAAGIIRGEEAYQMFLVGVSLAVAAIPERLPAFITAALAIGAQQMLRRNVIIRRFPAVETLGCTTVICSDKTGILTRNEMTVRKVFVGGNTYDVAGEGYDPKGEFTGMEDKQDRSFKLMMKAAALCNNAVLKRGVISVAGLFRGLAWGRPVQEWSILGDPTEGALLVMAAKAGFWRERLEAKESRVAELPFDPERKRMTVVYRQPAGNMKAYVKGAPDKILNLCTYYYKNGVISPLTEQSRKEILAQNAFMARKALRVLAFAYRELPASTKDFSEEFLEQQLIFLGLAGMIDPPKPAAIEAVQVCRRAGIKVIIITGDQRFTALAVAGELGINTKEDKVLTGSDLDRMSDEQLQEYADQVSVYASVSPKHKLQIVRALKNLGHVVAVTGDEVNDAPAVKEADIGVAMGITATDVTKEAAALVLTDDSFSSIVAAVEEGRSIYNNTRKFVRYLLSCNAGEVLVVLFAVLAGLPLPLMPVQILWVGLVACGFPAMALGVDPYERDIMIRPPRQLRESIFSHGLTWRIISGGAVIGLSNLLAFWLGFSLGDVALARTMAFNTLIFSQLSYVFTCRSEYRTILDVGVFTNPYLIGAVFIAVALQLVLNVIPFLQSVFHIVHLNALHWICIMAISAGPTVLGALSSRYTGKGDERFIYSRV